MFSHNGITEEGLKYPSLIRSLSKYQQTIFKVADILQNLSQDKPYTQLETSFLARHSNKTQESRSSVLQQCPKGSYCVTEFLIRIKLALGRNYDSHSPNVIDLIGHQFLEAVDSQAKINLHYHKSASLEKLAQHVDRLIARR